MRIITALTLFLLLDVLLALGEETPATTTIVIDAVVATVEEKPITLRDLGQRLSPPRAITLSDAANDPTIKRTLDLMIMEELVEIEAKSRNVGTSDDEINQYIGEVASRNQMTRDSFEAALKEEGKSMDDYKRDVRLDILKSKLASSLMRSGIGVSKEEIDQYLKSNSHTEKSGSKVKLRQILISLDNRSDEEAKERADAIKDRLDDDESFEELAREYSDGPEASEGGLVGTVAEEDLSRVVFDAIFELSEDEASDPVKTDAGYLIFFVEEKRVDKDEVSEDAREEARKILQQQKMEERMRDYFTSELYKRHSVDRKI